MAYCGVTKIGGLSPALVYYCQSQWRNSNIYRIFKSHLLDSIGCQVLMMVRDYGRDYGNGGYPSR